MKKCILIILCMILLVPCNVKAYSSNDLYKKYNIEYGCNVASEKVNLSVHNNKYYSYVLDKSFKPTNTNKKEAKKLDKKIKSSKKKAIIVYKKDYKNLEKAMVTLQNTKTKYTDFSCSSCVDNNGIIYYKVNKKSYLNAIKDSQSIDNNIKNIINICGIENGIEKGEAVQRVSNYFRQNYKYDYDQLKTNFSELDKNINYIDQTKKGICYDYAVFYKAILESIGIKCGLVIDNDGCHAYNCVIIANKKYYIDTCWNEGQTYNKYTCCQENTFFELHHKPGSIEWTDKVEIIKQ